MCVLHLPRAMVKVLAPADTSVYLLSTVLAFIVCYAVQSDIDTSIDALGSTLSLSSESATIITHHGVVVYTTDHLKVHSIGHGPPSLSHH